MREVENGASLDFADGLLECRKAIGEALSQRIDAIRIASSGAEEVEKKRKGLVERIDRTTLRQCIEGELEKIRSAATIGAKLVNLKARIEGASFTTVRRGLTTKHKAAHKALVLTEFSQKLDDEYQFLTDRDMAHFGVQLSTRGSDQETSVDPRIGGHEIHRVLSEGEQKVHALSLFFCELTAQLVSSPDASLGPRPLNVAVVEVYVRPGKVADVLLPEGAVEAEGHVAAKSLTGAGPELLNLFDRERIGFRLGDVDCGVAPHIPWHFDEAACLQPHRSVWTASEY